MAASVVFEPMLPADVPEVLSIERTASSSPWTAGLFLHELKVPFSRMRVARAADGSRVIAGYVCWWAVSDEVHILNLAVHPERRRTGVGRALVQLVVDDARRQGARTISLEVRPDNGAAQALYRRFDFVPCGLRRDYYARGQDAVIMMRAMDGDGSAAPDGASGPVRAG